MWEPREPSMRQRPSTSATAPPAAISAPIPPIVPPLCGRVVATDYRVEPPTEDHPHFTVLYDGYPLPPNPDMSVTFHDHAVCISPDFPCPILQMELTARIPVVLGEGSD